VLLDKSTSKLTTTLARQAVFDVPYIMFVQGAGIIGKYGLNVPGTNLPHMFTYPKSSLPKAIKSLNSFLVIDISCYRYFLLSIFLLPLSRHKTSARLCYATLNEHMVADFC